MSYERLQLHSLRALSRFDHLTPVVLLAPFFMTLIGCAAPQTERILEARVTRPPVVELMEVPFFPQEMYYCGPASLAMMLAWNNFDVTPDDLVNEVYTPGREGTFSQDIIAASRRNGRLAIEINDLDTVLQELEAGHPVLVMQNLALDFFPQWHFAVAIGYDLSGPQIILRSGMIERLLMPMDAFERTWDRADNWAIVVLPPSESPAAASEYSWLAGIAGLERAGHADNALIAYRSFLERHPANIVAKVGEANTLLTLKEYISAEMMYRDALARNPELAEAWNNLAYALYFQGNREGAIDAAERAISLAGSEGESEIYRDTLREVSGVAPQ